MTIGERLRQKREEKGISLEKAAQGTNIRIQFIQAIEEDQIDAMASSAQARGFARLYASFLGEDARTLFDGIDDNQPNGNDLGQKAVEIQSSTVKSEQNRPERKSSSKRKVSENASPRARFKDLIPNEQDLQQSSIIFKEIGEELRHQRETLGLSLADVERLTKIRETYLFNLEQGEVDTLPSTVQGRGILNNYSSFLSIDPVKLQNRFAEGLQQKRLETAAIAITSFDGKTVKTKKSPVTGWRKFITIDLLVGSSVFVILMVLVVWGAIQVIGSAQSKIEPTVNSISNVLINPGTPTSPNDIISPDAPQWTVEPSQELNTASVDILATITSVNTGSIQLVVIGVQRTYLKVIADGKEVFNGRVVPANVYTFTGSSKIVLLTGSIGGIQVYYNQKDLGILGLVGEVASLEFTSKGYLTSTPMFTASPTATLPPTLTQRATATPTVTPTIPTPTITPLTTLNP